MNAKVSIVVPNRWTWDAVCLTVESVLALTDYANYEIVVCDNSEGTGEANRIEYLKDMQEQGKIRLLENPMGLTMPKGRYGHGENIKYALKHVDSDLVMLLSSGCEPKHSLWLKQLVAQIEWGSVIGVAKLMEARNHFNNAWMPYRYIPNWMLLNMRIYRDFGRDNDFDLQWTRLDEFDRPEMFRGLEPLAHPDPEPEHVFLDTGYRLWERLEYFNPRRFKMASLAPDFPWKQMRLHDGLDRNSHRSWHPHVEKTRRNIQRRLKEIRNLT